jgi:hypothetical protein
MERPPHSFKEKENIILKSFLPKLMWKEDVSQNLLRGKNSEFLKVA